MTSWKSAGLFVWVLGIAAVCPPVGAQEKAKTVRRDPTDPQPVELATKDGVLLTGTFFPAEKAGKETPVVVMLADEDESPKVFDRLALTLQFKEKREGDDRPGISVLAIALRGQGDSTRIRTPGGELIDRRGARLTPADAKAMVGADMEAVRQFLVDKNDAGELNLNRLAYFGVGFGAAVAANAAAVDWAVPNLNRGKQGQDVKALILVSPPWKQLGLSMLPALRQPGVQKEVAVLVTYGSEDKRTKKDAERIIAQLEKGRPPIAEPAEGEKAPIRTVLDRPGKSKLQGTAWLKQTGRAGEQMIVGFLEEWLVKPEHPWTQRRLN